MASKLRFTSSNIKGNKGFTSICVSVNWLAAGWWSRLVVVLKFLASYGRRTLEAHLTKERRLCRATSVLKSRLGIKGKFISIWLLHKFRSGKLEGLLNKISLLHQFLPPLWSIPFGQYKITIVLNNYFKNEAICLSWTNSETKER